MDNRRLMEEQALSKRKIGIFIDQHGETVEKSQNGLPSFVISDNDHSIKSIPECSILTLDHDHGDHVDEKVDTVRPNRLSADNPIAQRRQSDVPKLQISGTMRNSISACNLPSLQSNPYHEPYHQSNKKMFYLDSDPRALSESDYAGSSFESLPDVCLTSPTGTKRPLGVPYAQPMQYLSNRYHKTRGRSSSSGFMDGNFNPIAGYNFQRGSKTASVSGPSQGALFSRQTTPRLSWTGDHIVIRNTQSSPTSSLHHDNNPLKHVKTEQVLTKHAVKARLSKLEVIMDKAFSLLDIKIERTVSEGLSLVYQIMNDAWHEPKIGVDVAYGLNDYMRESGYIDVLCQIFMDAAHFGDSCATVRMQTCKTLERCLSAANRELIFKRGYVDRILPIAMALTGDDAVRIVLQFLETLFKHSPRASLRLIELSALDYLLKACKSSSDNESCRLVSISLANLACTSDNECQQLMINKKIPDWLFLLASSQDEITRYYACLAICALVSNKEIEAAVIKSGTLTLVEPFLQTLKPVEFATGAGGCKHCGRPREFLRKLVQMLGGKRTEPRSLAAFHFAMDATIKAKQDRLDVLREIEAVEALKRVAALPEEVAPKFAIQALEIIGEELPRKLCQQVPLWTMEDVQYWICKIGFEEYASSFASQKVDGDLLLLLTPEDLKNDIGMKSSLLRKRFMKELNSLKMAADYSCVDATNLDRLLLSIDPNFSIYTYKLLEMGVDCSTFAQLTDEILRNDIENPVHRMKLCHWMEECKHGGDMEVALLRKQIDIFISYRRSTGNQLASLLKVLLQLRGYKVFIDVDRLYAGKFDSSLLKNIQAAKHFILVLTPRALDRCIGDDECCDWVHKEVLCALEHCKNVIPVFDPQFDWPEEMKLPADMRALARFNGVHWVHEYQEACVDKMEKFIKNESNIDRSICSGMVRSKPSSLINFRSSSRPAFSSINDSNMPINFFEPVEIDALDDQSENSRSLSLDSSI